MAKWLITGATGFLGRHVLDALESELGAPARDGEKIALLGRSRPDGWPDEAFVPANFDDPDGLRETIRSVAPDQVIHTAGRIPPASDEELYRGNFWTTIRLFNALRGLGRPVRVTIAGSAAELGPVPAAELPVDESHPCNPIEAYGRSKWLATIAALAEKPPLEVMVGRVFNPVGPGLPATQAFGGFAAQLLSGGADPLPLVTGDLEARRDFVDVRDAARAMVSIALRGQPGKVYHIGTGSSRPVGEGLDQLIRLSKRSVKVCVDHRRRARKGPADSRADIRRITAHTGWTPSIPLEQSLSDLWTEAKRPHAASGRHAGIPLPLTA
jgi:nucleoside-diphosphate-sugar epimerase